MLNSSRLIALVSVMLFLSILLGIDLTDASAQRVTPKQGGFVAGILFDFNRDQHGLTVKTDGEEAPVIELVNSLIAQAFEERASDVHVEPAEREFRVRFRLDGVLQTRLTLERDRFDPALASGVRDLVWVNAGGGDDSEKNARRTQHFSKRSTSSTKMVAPPTSTSIG